MVGATCQKNDKGHCRLVWSINESIPVTHWHTSYDKCIEELFEIIPATYEDAIKKYPGLHVETRFWNNALPMECWEVLYNQDLLKGK